VRILYILILR